MAEFLRYRMIYAGLIVGQVLFKLLFVPVGLLMLSAAGLVLSGYYGHALVMLVAAELLYHLGFWLLVGKWQRRAE